MAKANEAKERSGWRRMRRRYHFHTPAVLYIGVSLLLAVGALNSQNNLLFWAMGLAFGGLIVSGVLSGSSLMGLRLERQTPVAASVGDTVPVRYVLTNVNRFLPACALHIEELDGPAGDAPAPTWPERISTPRAYVAVLSPRERIVAEARVQPERRGEATFSGVRVWSTFPFGLMRKSVTFVQPAGTLVRPAVIPLKRGVVEGAARISTSARYSGTLSGTGEEFHSLRPYRPGDPPRMIAWRPTARSGELVTRVLASPPPVRLWLLLEADVRRDDPEAVERAITLAASLLGAGQKRGYAVGLLIPSAGIMLLPRSTDRHLERLLDQLAVVEPGGRPVGQRRLAPFSHAGAAGGCLVIHAGPLNRRIGPAWARHLSHTDLEALRAPPGRNAAGRRSLTLDDLTPAGPGAGPMHRDGRTEPAEVVS